MGHHMKFAFVRTAAVVAISGLFCLHSFTLAASSPVVDPEAATGISIQQKVFGAQSMVVTANPLASQAGQQMLAAGGSAVDAAIAVQLMLSLVEPQSSGIGGGLFMLHYDAAKKQLQTIDGRETAPAAADPDWFMQQGKPLPWSQAYVGGKAVGSPGVIKALALAHQKWGKLPWAELFQPAIERAEQGFLVSPRLAKLLQIYQDGSLARFAASKAYFYPAGQPLAAGHLLKNPAYAAVLRKIASEGTAGFYQGDNAKALVQAVNQAAVNPGKLTLQDLSQYQPVLREPICLPYRQYQVCGMAPPSSGSLAVLQMLGILQHFELASLKPQSVPAVHLLAQASRLAFADRDRYVADPAFSPVPVAGLLAADYLKQRAALIDPKLDSSQVAAGLPKGAVALASAKAVEFTNTTHYSIVDSQGNAVSLTSSIENAFGSGLLVNGYLLNNQMTDFSLEPSMDGFAVANRVEALKRPRSSMAPMMVFSADGQLQMLAGSPGGSRIINYVAQALVGMIDWQLDPQQAANLAKITHRNDHLALEAGTELVGLAPKLRELGYQVKVVDLNSGLHLIKRTANGWLGGADPRREGKALAELKVNNEHTTKSH
jgi:gamma-glutamyltranspeptidase/glutathione hydrolase